MKSIAISNDKLNRSTNSTPGLLITSSSESAEATLPRGRRNRVTIDAVSDLEEPIRRLPVEEPPEQRHLFVAAVSGGLPQPKPTPSPAEQLTARPAPSAIVHAAPNATANGDQQSAPPAIEPDQWRSHQYGRVWRPPDLMPVCSTIDQQAFLKQPCKLPVPSLLLSACMQPSDKKRCSGSHKSACMQMHVHAGY